MAESGTPTGSTIRQPVRAESLLAGPERLFLHVDRLIERFLPESLNPLLHTGAVAITTMALATVTGIVLLLWYRPSLHLAYTSVEAMSEAPWTAGLLRSLHRYSSDACVFFVLVHALRLLFERRFVGARWLAWVTGIASAGVLWFVGWTGYWLVWDERGQHVAIGTARMLDSLPIFVDSMGRSFLFDAGVNSLVFFVVFFLHMMVPLALVTGLWLHTARLTRARFLTSTPLTIWTVGSLLLLSIAYPAESAGPAQLTALGQRFTIDTWYLLPLALSDRLDGGALWSILLMAGIGLGAIPWWLPSGRPAPALVSPERCNACMQCWQDCPYDAISMVPRAGEAPRYPLEALVDPAKCVGCGICSASCDTVGIDLTTLSVLGERQKLEGWLKEAGPDADPLDVAFVCANSAGAGLGADPETGECAELPGYRVLQVPCAGWIHMLTLERALRRGARTALVVACGPGTCHYREGSSWLKARLDGERAPMLRTNLVERNRIELLELGRTQKRELLRRARAWRRGERGRGDRPSSQLRIGLANVVLAVGLAGIVGFASDFGYSAPRPDGSELVVSLKHPGRTSEQCRQLSAEEQAKQPVHMRRTEICERRRAPVRLRVHVDGDLVVDSAYAPAGIWGDLNSSAVVSVPLAPAEHRVQVAIGDSLDADEWTFQTEATLEFKGDARRVLAFDRLSGFTWH